MNPIEDPRGSSIHPIESKLGAKMRGNCLTTVFTLLAVAVSGCEQARLGIDVTRTDSAGIEVVISRGSDRALDWQFEAEFSLGGVEDGPQSFYRVSARNLGVDGVGRIHVLDHQENRVVIFSSDGLFEGELGGHGEGPGELSSPWDLAVSPDGGVSVFDFGKRGLVQFSPDGTYSGLQPFRFTPAPDIPRYFEVHSEAIVVLARLPIEDEERVTHALLLVQNGDTTSIAAWDVPQSQMVWYDVCNGGLRLSRLFEVELPWDSWGPEIVSSNSPAYTLDFYDGPTLIRRLSRELPLLPATEALALEELGEGYLIRFGGIPCLIPADDMVRGRGVAEYVPWIQAVSLSPSGEIWVRRRDENKTSESVIDLFGRGGEYIGTLPRAAPFPLVFVGEDRFGAAETDEFDVTRLVVYRVIRG